MEVAEFEFLRDLLLKESGLVVTMEKIYLLESRLGPVANKNKFASISALVSDLRLKKDTKLVYEVVEAMTTNETSFFRDGTPFDRMREAVIPYMLKTRTNRKIRIWCAACSSGQEPYSLAMMIKETPELAGWNVEILGTDLSEEILDQSRQGIYTQFEVQRGLPIKLLVKYFTQNGDKWHIKDEIKSMVKLKKANLLTDIKTMGSFDIIFCRNVLIYFNSNDKAKVFSDIKHILAQDGFLFLGGAETVIGISNDFKPIATLKGVYVRDDTTYTV